MNALISPLASVHPQAKLGSGVTVAPFAVIEEGAVLGDNCKVASHAVVYSGSVLGQGVSVGAGSQIGAAPQDLSYQGQPTQLHIGNHTIIGELAIISRASGEQPTRIGAHCYIMGHAHVGHDCQLESHVIITHGAMLSGHVRVGQGAILGGQAGVHQFVHIGAGAMVGAQSGVGQDILPYTMCHGYPAKHYGLNRVGLRRNKVPAASIRALEQAYHALRHGQPLPEALCPEAILFAQAAQAPSKRHFASFID